MASKKQTPKGSKFKTPLVCSFKMNKYKFSPVVDTTSLMSHPVINAKLPPIPNPSERLRLLLLTYNALNNPPNKEVLGCAKDIMAPRVRNKKRYGKINGFIAFRTFYCKSVLNSNHQRSLSKHLAEIWRTEQQKNQWKLYAAVYNLRERTDIPFVEWLCKCLNIGEDLSTSSISPKLIVTESQGSFLSSASTKSVIEDLFLVKPDV
uniref:MAT alpha 1 protein n=1 Tax=Suhomyces atakaporum TaxID=246088 RepID=A0A3Q9FFF3_9ASCO|nr:MAT alpha 1 protein [Suhomyces atakaporum]